MKKESKPLKMIFALISKTTGFTLVELMVVLLLSSIFLIGLTQYTLTGWRLIWREKSVLAALGEARSIHNILMFGGGKNGAIASLRGEASGVFTFTAVNFSGNAFDSVIPASGNYTFYTKNDSPASVDFRGHRFCENSSVPKTHLLQYGSNSSACMSSPDYQTLYSPYIDENNKRHGYLRDLNVEIGGSASDIVTIDATIDDFNNINILFQPADPTADGNPDYFKQKFRFVAFGH